MKTLIYFCMPHSAWQILWVKKKKNLLDEEVNIGDFSSSVYTRTNPENSLALISLTKTMTIITMAVLKSQRLWVKEKIQMRELWALKKDGR